MTAIDRAAKTVTAKNLVTGEEKALPYDRLIIATGSTPKVPPVEGRDLKNVGGANNLEDADALRKACASGSVQNAVVIGAGFIGMEIAVALADMWDIKTSVWNSCRRPCPASCPPACPIWSGMTSKNTTSTSIPAKKCSALKVKTGLWPAS